MSCESYYCRVILPFATLSSLGAAFIIFCIFFFKMHRNTSGRLLLCLSIADMIHAVSIQMSYHFIDSGPFDGGMCQFQAFILELGDMASPAWTISIALYTLLMVKNKKAATKTLEKVSYVVCWGIPLFFSFLGLGLKINGEKAYGPIGPWCWITVRPYRVLFFFGWVYATFLTLVILYGLMLHHLWKISRSSSETKGQTATKAKRIMRKMAGYPLVFFIVFFPRTIDSSVGIGGGVPHSDGYYLFAVIFFCSNGFFNALMYGFTRRIIQRFASRVFSISTSSANISTSHPTSNLASVRSASDASTPQRVYSTDTVESV